MAGVAWVDNVLMGAGVILALVGVFIPGVSGKALIVGPQENPMKEEFGSSRIDERRLGVPLERKKETPGEVARDDWNRAENAKPWENDSSWRDSAWPLDWAKLLGWGLGSE